LESPRQPLPRPTIHSHAHPRGIMRTAVACSTSDRKPSVLGATAHEHRSIRTPFPTAWRDQIFKRTPRSRGPLSRSSSDPSAGVEPPSATIHSNCARLRSNCVRRCRRAPHCTLHCSRRCRPLGACVGSTRSYGYRAAQGAALRLARPRGRGFLGACCALPAQHLEERCSARRSLGDGLAMAPRSSLGGTRLLCRSQARCSRFFWWSISAAYLPPVVVTEGC
jgi:hypothetical protein